MRSTPIEQIMSKSLVTVGENDTLATIRQIFTHAKFHHLLVTADDKLVGVISDRDLFKAISPTLDTPSETLEDVEMLNRRAREIMTTEIFSLTERGTIGDAIDLFNQYPISCIPVVNGADKPIGIVSWRDILQAIPEE